jgi:hypothetical protein
VLKVVAWPEKTPVQGGFADITEVVDRGLDRGGGRERADSPRASWPEGSGRRAAADDYAGYARDYRSR